MKKVILAVVTFLAIQLLSSVLMLAAVAIMGVNMGVYKTTVLGITLVIANILGSLVCWKGLKMIEIPATFDASKIKWGWALTAILASIFGVLAGDLLSEQMDLSNLIADQIVDMANNTWGVLAIALIGPIAEELIFREGVCGHILRNGDNPWKAIWISAVLFGLIHLNPAQIPFAILMGVILGVIYVKTGNIVVTSIIHVLNNTFAVSQVWMLGDDVMDFRMADWMGGNVVAGVCIILGFAICFYLLRRFWEADVTVEADELGGYDKG